MPTHDMYMGIYGTLQRCPNEYNPSIPPWSVCAVSVVELFGPSPAALNASIVNVYSVYMRSDVTTVSVASPATVTSCDALEKEVDSQKKICKNIVFTR